MAMAVSSSSLHLSLPLRRSTTNSLLTLRGPQMHSQRALPQGLISNSIRRIVSKRNLLVRAAENNQSNESESRRLEEIEARLGVGRKSRREGGGAVEAPPAPRPKVPAKAWDDMSLPEKAWELYIGEKGALFWLNKLAYAAIFIIIGGWIVFRFIGPALGWYELDSPLLPPSEVLSGTAGVVNSVPAETTSDQSKSIATLCEHGPQLRRVKWRIRNKNTSIALPL